MRLLILQQPKAGADNFAGRAVPSRRNLPGQEAREMVVQTNRSVLSHAIIVPNIGTVREDLVELCLNLANRDSGWLGIEVPVPVDLTIQCPTLAASAAPPAPMPLDAHLPANLFLNLFGLFRIRQ